MVTNFRNARLAACLACLLLSPICDAQYDGVPEAVRLEIEYFATAGRLDVRGVALASGGLLTEFYERRRFAPAWTDLDKIAELIAAIEAAEADGLRPSDYHLAEVAGGYRLLEGGGEVLPAERAELDILFTESLVRLGYHQRFGKVNPYTLDPQWNFRRELNHVDPATAMQRAIDAGSLLEHLRTIFPRGFAYRRLQEALSRYRQIAANGGWPSIPADPTLRPGDSDPRVPLLRQRLSAVGDLPADLDEASGELFDAALEEGVRRFQHRHGLDADGIVGAATMRALNVPVDARVRQIEINLERARWVLDDVGNHYVLVNIAGFRAYLVRDRDIVWETRVQVGSTYHKTPVFRDALRYLVFNPTWTVPYSIATKEMLPDIKANPDYFARRDFDVLSSKGRLVDPDTVAWSSFSARSLPYTFVQRPGPNNALGRVKFMFPNEHAVYLHDTPSKSLFEKAGRAFSHGCIRVQNPLELAGILLGQAGWSRQRIDEVVARGETTTVFLPEPLPILLLYWTAEADPDGVVHFYPDIYERDDAIAAGLDAEFSLDLPSAPRE